MNVAHGLKLIQSRKMGMRRGPAQDVPFDLILWYIAKTIPNF